MPDHVACRRLVDCESPRGICKFSTLWAQAGPKPESEALLLKFLFCGTGIIGGIVLLFAASFGDVGQLPERLYSSLAMQFGGAQPSAGQAATPAQIKVAQATPDAHSSESATQDHAADGAEQEAVRQQLQELQKEAAQALRETQGQSATPAGSAQPGETGSATNGAKTTTVPQPSAAAQPMQTPAAPQAAPQPAAPSAPLPVAAQPVPPQPPAAPASPQPVTPQPAPPQPATAQAAQPGTGALARQQASTAAEAAELRHQREILEDQLQKLRAEIAATSQAVAALHSRADSEREDIDSLQRQRVAEKAAIERMKAEQAAAQAKAEQQAAIDRRAAELAAQAQKQQAQEAKATEAASRQRTRARAPKAEAASAIRAPEAGHPEQQIRAADTGVVEAVLNRLRHHGGSGSTPLQSVPDGAAAGSAGVQRQAQLLQQQRGFAAPGPTASSQQAGGAPPGADYGAPQSLFPQQQARTDAIPSRPPPAGAQQRLAMARAALLAGQLGQAQQLLEEAQLQLVFRPVAPDAEGPPDESHAAGEVAEALNLLGAGDANGALHFLDQALAEEQVGSYQPWAPPAGYGGMAPPGAPR